MINSSSSYAIYPMQSHLTRFGKSWRRHGSDRFVANAAWLLAAVLAWPLP